MSDSTPDRLLTRRRLLVAALGAACCADMFVVEPRWLETSRHRITIDGLPRSLEGFTVAQISDAHLANAGVAIETLVEAVRRASPQLVVLTGDLIEAEGELPLLADLCHQLRGVGGAIVAILGNWEHWGDVPIDLLRACYRDAGAELLINEGKRVEGLWIAATDDGLGGLPDWHAATRDLPSGASRLLLTHSPALLDAAPAGIPPFELALAGHTHGGQASLGGWAPAVPPGSGRFVAGDYQTRVGRAYVSRGTGTSVIPGRLMCRPELPVFELVGG